MTKKVLTIDTQAGIQRDGTVFDMNFYTSGKWVRFQRNRPRKIGGYRSITNNATGYSRGIYVNATNGINQIFNGTSSALEVLNIDNTGIGAGVNQFTLSNFTSSTLNLWQFDSLYDSGGSGNQLLLAHPGQNLAQIDAVANTPVLQGSISGTTMSKIGTFSIAATLNSTTTVTVASTTQIGAGQLVTGTGIPSNTTVSVVINATSFTISNAIGRSNSIAFD
jgi:hypothetical protein